MTDLFFTQPILNSPYDYPNRHWELDSSGQPTHEIIESRRRAEFITPIPKAKGSKGKTKQQELVLDDSGLSTQAQQYDKHSQIINSIREKVDLWREIPNSARWNVTPETERLLKHWRHHKYTGIRPFFCQVEAVETMIWLTEVAPKSKRESGDLLDYLERANLGANPELLRYALKLATGAGKTTVMAMLIAWQTINAVRHPLSKSFTKGFLIIAPGLTIRDRLRVLQPNDPESYYRSRELVPQDMLIELGKAKIIITNYHAFKLRERIDISKGARALLKGRNGEDIQTLESEGQMIQRVMPELMGMKNILVINDEAHHCYRSKPPEESEEDSLKGDEKKEAEKNKEAARLWISGIEMVKRQLGVQKVVDLSATPFFLSGSGYAEGTLFPWTVCDFSLMDALECGIVKLPRVPISDNLGDNHELPMYRDLWSRIGKKMPKKARKGNKDLDPADIPAELQTALSTLYGHYEKTYNLWQQHQISVPPCFIIVCNNTATSKLVYDYVSGFFRELEDGTSVLQQGRLELFRNFDEHENPIPRPRTLLIDSTQLEIGELDNDFRKLAKGEIEQFRREIVERTGDHRRAEKLSDAELLREVMNTVGKKDRLGESVRCVVSVSMLTEGWDANTVTHVLGIRAFGTQLLCEQVIGRALRRQSYELNDQGLFDVEYADVFGIPFDFTAKPTVAKPTKPRETIQVKAVRPERDHMEIKFPRVLGYRTDLPEERMEAKFDHTSTLTLTRQLVGPTINENQGIIGEGVLLTLEHTKKMRRSKLIKHLTLRLLQTRYKDVEGKPKYHLFSHLQRITRQWLNDHLVCKDGTYPAQLMYQVLADMACERISAGITRFYVGNRQIKAMVDPYNPVGSTINVNFQTSQSRRFTTGKSHINYAILDSDWESEFCRVVEKHPQVIAYVKNHNLGFEVPYRFGSQIKQYRPDFIVLIDDGKEDPLQLVVEIKGFRSEDVNDKQATIETYWVPGVNNLKTYGRWAFAQFEDVLLMDAEFKEKVEGFFEEMVQRTLSNSLAA